MKLPYQFRSELFVRAPFYSFTEYDLVRLPEVLDRQTFRNALALASPVFFETLQKKDFDFGRLSVKEKHTLAKYYNRMCFRPTPFGAFSSFSILQWGKDTTIRLAPDSGATLHLLPDQEEIARLNRMLTQNPQRPGLRLNPTLYVIGKEIRLIRSVADEKGCFRFILEAIELLPFYTLLMDFFKNKSISASQLLQWIREQTACSEDDARDYVDFLLETQVMIGPEQGYIILAEDGRDLYGDLKLSLPASSLLPGKRLWPVMQELKAQPISSPYYAAVERPAETGSLDALLQEELLEVIGVLDRLSPPTKSPVLQKFIQEFTERYDLEKIPLLRALDPEAGIAYGNLTSETPGERLGDDLDIAGIPQPEASLEWEAIRRLLLRLWPGERAGEQFRNGITLMDRHLESIAQKSETGKLPSTLPVIFRKSGDHILIEHLGGAIANNLNGRFSVFSEQVHRLCLDLAAQEQAAHPLILFADIGQLSDHHNDNINRRRQIYPFEIPLNVHSLLQPQQQLLPQDLLLSVRNGELLLESAVLGKRVIPRLPTAYNFRKTDSAIFNLLCDLQYQGLNSPRELDLEKLFPGLDFYPRVTYKRCILTVARWKIPASEVKILSGNRGSALLPALRTFREKHHLPACISMGREDQKLIFDLTDPQEAQFFGECLPAEGEVLIQEYLMPDRTLRAGLHPLAGQFITYLSHPDMIYSPLARENPDRSKVVARQYALGSEWLYLKFYCTPRQADRLLIQVIGPLIQEFNHQLSGWFFIRYEDPKYHLRLRCRLAESAIGPFLSRLNQWLETSGQNSLLQNYQSGTYERELERYGADLIGEVEDYFGTGSRLVMTAIRQAEGTTAQSRFALALATIYRLTRTCFPDNTEAIRFTGQMVTAFIREFGETKALKVSLDRKFRLVQNFIGDWCGQVDKNYPLAPGNLDGLWAAMELQLTRMKSKLADPVRAEQLLADLIHMQLNRIFSTRSREQEMLAYHHLNRYLVSFNARRTGGK